ncbi:50S ribosomal protein L17 [Patescibacteria group bacterium]|nr:50S ribosomal protein L17 [Patescibacteria group bacterium]
MKKRKAGRVFSRKTGPRKALLKSVARSLLEHGRITTTEARAKEVSRFLAPYITKAKKGDLAARRYLLQSFDLKSVRKLMDEIAPRYAERPGGYTRIIKLEPRKADGARMALIELV